MSETAARPLVSLFALILAGLQGIIADAMPRHPTRLALLVLAHTRLRRMVARFASLVVRAQAGTLRQYCARHCKVCVAGKPKRTAQGFAWLLRLGSWRAAAYRSQLQHLLADPEMERLLQTAPQAGRILRPLCHALGIRPLPELLRIRPRPATRAALSDPPNRHAAVPPRTVAMRWPVQRQAETVEANVAPTVARRPDS